VGVFFLKFSKLRSRGGDRDRPDETEDTKDRTEGTDDTEDTDDNEDTTDPAEDGRLLCSSLFFFLSFFLSPASALSKSPFISSLLADGTLPERRTLFPPRPSDPLSKETFFFFFLGTAFGASAFFLNFSIPALPGLHEKKSLAFF
jgi:hypothetical protein